MHAHACENLLPYFPKLGERGGAILDVGSGSGYRQFSSTVTAVGLLLAFRMTDM